MTKKKFLKTAAGFFLALNFIFFLYSPHDETVQAFNQSNLVRVTEIQEVDGRIIFRRLAPVAGMHP
ncbi:MAG: hypothetical protein DDT21_00710 [Syntrophomonadaceae bacterium]|nr:hypothetical protein [Bacillota bacterium]